MVPQGLRLMEQSPSQMRPVSVPERKESFAGEGVRVAPVIKCSVPDVAHMNSVYNSLARTGFTAPAQGKYSPAE